MKPKALRVHGRGNVDLGLVWFLARQWARLRREADLPSTKYRPGPMASSTVEVLRRYRRRA